MVDIHRITSIPISIVKVRVVCPLITILTILTWVVHHRLLQEVVPQDNILRLVQVQVQCGANIMDLDLDQDLDQMVVNMEISRGPETNRKINRSSLYLDNNKVVVVVAIMTVDQIIRLMKEVVVGMEEEEAVAALHQDHPLII